MKISEIVGVGRLRFVPWALVAALVAAAPAAAQTISSGLPDSVGDVAADEADDDNWRFSVGLGAAIVPDYEGSDHYEFVPLPMFTARKKPYNVTVFGPKLSANVLPSEHWRLGPVIQFHRKRGNVHSGRVDAMKNIDPAASLGLQGGYDTPMAQGILSLEVEWVHDITDTYDGWLLTPQINWGRRFDRWNLITSSSFTVASNGYMDTYFGVSASDSARSGLPQYNPSTSLKDVQFAAALSYDITEDFDLGFLGVYKKLVWDANNDSPVVDVGSTNQLIGSIFLTYSF